MTNEIGVGDWVSGYFVAKLVLTSGDGKGTAATVPLIVRAPPERRTPILVQVGVNTWQAYNPWGGTSLYFNAAGGPPATQVSFARPYIYYHQWPVLWDYQLVRFLEREGYDVAYTSDIDTDASPQQLLVHRLVIVAGHDEYWTQAIRTGFEDAVAEGVNLAFLGANAGYWQVRYADSGTTIVSYKSRSDPEPNPAFKTIRFRDLIPPRPECALMGVQYQGGVRASDDPPRDYTVVAPSDDAWLAGTGLRTGATLPGLVGNEWDSVVPNCTPPSATVLFHYSGLPAPADAVRYVAPSGARIFSSGSMQFSWGLDQFGHPELPRQRGLERFMVNALDAMSRPPAPQGVTATLTSSLGVSIVVAPGAADAHVLGTRVYATDISNGGVGRQSRQLCTTDSTGRCLAPHIAGHRLYRVDAVTYDDWGTESAAASATLTVPNARPRVAIRVRTLGSRAIFAAAASDADNDTLQFHWLIDGRASAAGMTVSVNLRSGRHTVAVTTVDGHGGIARAVKRVVIHR